MIAATWQARLAFRVSSLALSLMTLALCSVGSSPAQAAAGFDCARAATAGEKAICGNRKLSILDAKLNELFEAATSAPQANKNTLRDEQLRWLRTRDRACGSIAKKDDMVLCLEGAYVERLAAISRSVPDSEIEVPGSNGVLQRIGEIDGYTPRYPWRSEDGYFVFMQYDATENAREVISLDPLTRKGKKLGAHLSEADAWKVMNYNPYGCGECLSFTRRFDDHYTAYSDRGTVVVNDLIKRSEQTFPRREGASSARYDISGDLLFMLPEDSAAHHMDMEVYDLKTGRQLARFPFPADTFVIHGDILAAVYTETNYAAPTRYYAHLPISLYRIKPGDQPDNAADIVLQDTYRRAKAAFAATHSVLDALDILQPASVGPLLDAEHLTPDHWSIVVDYASWLAATLPKREAGIQLLGKLLAAKPGDADLTRRLGGAYLNAYLISGAARDFDRARELLVPLNEWSADLEGLPALKPPGQILFANYGDILGEYLFLPDKIIVGFETTITAYDRVTMRRLWESKLDPAIAPMRAITFSSNRIQVWLTSQPDGKTGPDVVVVNPDNGDFQLATVGTGFTRAVAANGSLTVCQNVPADDMHEFCTLLDEKTLKPVAGNLSVPTLGFTTMNGDWLVAQGGGWPGPYNITFHSIREPSGPWESIDHNTSISSSLYAMFSSDPNLLLFADRIDNDPRILRADLKNKTVSRLIDAGYVFTTNGKWLWAGKGRDLYMYDLSANRLAAVLRNVIPDRLRDLAKRTALPTKIDQLVFDGAHLMAITYQGETGRDFDMKELEAFADKMGAGFAKADLLMHP